MPMGDPVEVTVVLVIDFGQRRMPAKFIVVDIGHGGILGMNALRAWGATVNARQGRVNLYPPSERRQTSSPGDGGGDGGNMRDGSRTSG